MSNSLISIILPYYKKEKYVHETIKSILNQTHQNFEILIVNDELSDASFQVLEKISKIDNRIKVLNNKKNIGAGPSRNFAIDLSNGKYIAFCDCDDLWKLNKLERQFQNMEKYNQVFSFTDYEIINDNNLKVDFREAKNNLNFTKLRNSCDIGLSTVMLKKSILNNKKFRFGEIKTKEDFVLWLILAQNEINLSALNECLVSWRKSTNSLSSSTIQKLIDGFRVYKNYLHYGYFKSFYFLMVLSANYMLKKFK
ncbi:glycosyltransferase family 2 protein [Pelagibacterales bacterium SAG-MED39]|nr:glycosyltransferase family 2 protein [Pelagibacterales bacterium SAG-MED39]